VLASLLEDTRPPRRDATQRMREAAHEIAYLARLKGKALGRNGLASRRRNAIGSVDAAQAGTRSSWSTTRRGGASSNRRTCATIRPYRCTRSPPRPVGAENPDSGDQRSAMSVAVRASAQHRGVGHRAHIHNNVRETARHLDQGGAARMRYAASRYSWISPPTRSRRRIRSSSITSAGGRSPLDGSSRSGGCCPSPRCGWCSL
jgi:hypothetical protein